MLALLKDIEPKCFGSTYFNFHSKHGEKVTPGDIHYSCLCCLDQDHDNLVEVENYALYKMPSSNNMFEVTIDNEECVGTPEISSD